MEVQISNITIKVGKKKVTLSLAESKALFEKLNEIFGPKYNYYYAPTTTTVPITWTATGNSTTGLATTVNTTTLNTTDTNNNLSLIGE